MPFAGRLDNTLPLSIPPAVIYAASDPGAVGAGKLWTNGTTVKVRNQANSAWVDVSGTTYTDEQAQDAVGAMVNATLTYVDATPSLGIATSVALPGSPTTTTQSPGDNSTKIATTAYVDASTGAAANPVNDDLFAQWRVPGSPNAMDDEFDGSSSATWTDINSPVYSLGANSLIFDPASATDAKRIRVQTAPSAPYTAYCALTSYAASGATDSWGMWFRESSSGKLYVMQYEAGSAGGDLSVHHYSGTGSGTFVATDIGAVGSKCIAHLIWLAVTDDGTNLKFRYSPDGARWVQIGSVARNAYMTAPNQVGIGYNAIGSVAPGRFHHFRVVASATPPQA